MEDEPRQKLGELIAAYGRALVDNPGRCEGLLRDVCSTYRREIAVLVSALKEGVAAELRTASVGVPTRVVLARLTQRLQDNLGLTAEAARWAVESWALALGALSSQELTPLVPRDAAQVPPVPLPRSRRKWKTVVGVALIIVLAVAVSAVLLTSQAGRQIPAEVQEARQRAEVAQRQAEATLLTEQQARQKAEAAQKQAEIKWRQEQEARQKAEAAQKQVEAKLLTEQLVRRPPEEKGRQADPQRSLRLTWRDNAIAYKGLLQFSDQREATMNAELYDINTGTFIKKYTFTFVVKRNSLTVAANVPIEMDNITPFPHYHQVNIVLERQSNGSWQGENCHSSGCYPVM